MTGHQWYVHDVAPAILRLGKARDGAERDAKSEGCVKERWKPGVTGPPVTRVTAGTPS